MFNCLNEVNFGDLCAYPRSSVRVCTQHKSEKKEKREENYKQHSKMIDVLFKSQPFHREYCEWKQR